jgi:hypothetical protein
MAKDIVCTFASSQSITSSKEVAKVLGVDRIINIKKASERWLLLDTLLSGQTTKGLSGNFFLDIGCVMM